MPTGTEKVFFFGETGREQPVAKMTRMTHLRRHPSGTPASACPDKCVRWGRCESAALSSGLAKPSCTTVGVTQVPRYPVKMSPMRKGLNRTNTVSREWLAGIVLMFEQLFRFLNFGEILSRIEIDEDWCEYL